jgi:hypothetical protein
MRAEAMSFAGTKWLITTYSLSGSARRSMPCSFRITADMAVVMSLLMMTSGRAVTKSPGATEALADFFARIFSLIVMAMALPFLAVDRYVQMTPAVFKWSISPSV